MFTGKKNEDVKTLSALVQQVKDGDTKAFEQIYNMTSRDVYYVSLKIIGNEQDCKDTVQEIFLRVYRNIQKLKDNNAFTTWLYKITLNTCRNKIKAMNKMKRYEDIDDYIDLVHEADTSVLPAEVADQAGVRELFLKAIEKLSIDQKEVILMFYYKNMSLKEISNVLGITVRATQGRLSRARIAIKDTVSLERNESVLFGGTAFTGLITLALQENAKSIVTANLQLELWTTLAGQLAAPIAQSAVPIIGKVVAAAAAVTVTATAVMGGFQKEPAPQVEQPVDTPKQEQTEGEKPKEKTKEKPVQQAEEKAPAKEKEVKKEYKTLADFIGQSDADVFLNLSPEKAFLQMSTIKAIYQKHKFTTYAVFDDLGEGGSSYTCKQLIIENRRLLIYQKVDSTAKKAYFTYDIASTGKAKISPEQLPDLFE